VSRGRFAQGLLAGVCALGLSSGTAGAAPVVVLGAHGKSVVREDPFLNMPALTPPPVGASSAIRPRAHQSARRNAHSELARLRRARVISASEYHRYLSSLDAAAATARHLTGTRAVELNAVLANISQIASAGQLWTSRLKVLFLTLDSNRRWWSTGPLLAYGERVEFSGSQLVWEYYPGQGIELQELGSFGKADGMYTGGPQLYAQMRRLLAELIPLAAYRGGGLTWEYYFKFDGGIPPWTSAMSQGTAILALSRAYLAFHDRKYLSIARRAMPIFGERPPTGVSVTTPRGLRFLLYSFATQPSQAVLNGFLQTLIGLYDYAQVSGDARAARLFAAGDAEARYEVPHYDTGSWSLYQPGELSSVDYHVLVTGFLHELCDRTHAQVYCQTAARFDSYVHNQ
jgi:D-glucuronyl C5-epimerase C-terminus